MARSTASAYTTGPCLQPRYSPSTRWKARPVDNNQTDQATDSNSTFPPTDQNGSNPFVDNNQTETDQNATGPAPGDPVVTLFVPCPRPSPVRNSRTAKFRFWGQILADGGSPVTKVAFELGGQYALPQLHPAFRIPFPGQSELLPRTQTPARQALLLPGGGHQQGGHDGRINQEAHHLGGRNPLVVRYRPDARRLAYIAVVRNLPQARKHRMDLPCPTGLGLRAPRRFGWLVALVQGSPLAMDPIGRISLPMESRSRRMALPDGKQKRKTRFLPLRIGFDPLGKQFGLAYQTAFTS